MQTFPMFERLIILSLVKYVLNYIIPISANDFFTAVNYSHQMTDLPLVKKIIIRDAHFHLLQYIYINCFHFVQYIIPNIGNPLLVGGLLYDNYCYKISQRYKFEFFFSLRTSFQRFIIVLGVFYLNVRYTHTLSEYY